ncbi:10325_t:CDS:2, partial [Ambispora leptoticha]
CVFAPWTSGNYEIDEIILDAQVHYNGHHDWIEWIPYEQLLKEKYFCENEFYEVYFAIWGKGRVISYDRESKSLIREEQGIVQLNLFSNLDYLFCSLKSDGKDIFGVSKDPCTQNFFLIQKPSYCLKCKLNWNTTLNICPRCDFLPWTSGNDKIDEILINYQIQFRGFKYHNWIEWISYDNFNKLELMVEEQDFDVYKAIWEPGRITDFEEETKRLVKQKESDVQLNIYSNFDSFYNIICSEFYVIHGVSKDPATHNYILVRDLEYCMNCNLRLNLTFQLCPRCYYLPWTSGNVQIDELIIKRQIECENSDKWIECLFEKSFDELFNEIEVIEENKCYKVYNAIWNMGRIQSFDHKLKKFNREEKSEVQLNEYSNLDYLYEELKNDFSGVYGIMKHTLTNDIILIKERKFCSKCKATWNIFYQICFRCHLSPWSSGDMRIDEFIINIQNKFDKPLDEDNNDNRYELLEWIPYEKIKNREFIKEETLYTVYKATLEYDRIKNITKQKSLERLNKSQTVQLDIYFNSEQLYNALNRKYNEFRYCLFGISKSPSGNFILVRVLEFCSKCRQKWNLQLELCPKCDLPSWTSGHPEIDDFILDEQRKYLHSSQGHLKFNGWIEWIPYNQFSKIENLGEGGFARVSKSIWKKGKTYYDSANKSFKRCYNWEVALKEKLNSKGCISEFIKETKILLGALSHGECRLYSCNVYGISQNPNTGNFILVLEYFEDGSLYSRLSKDMITFHYKVILKILKNILKGLIHAHSENLVHGNLHSGNILGDLSGEPVSITNANFKLSDFGISKIEL